MTRTTVIAFLVAVTLHLLATCGAGGQPPKFVPAKFVTDLRFKLSPEKSLD